ncbi:MAG: glycosyltransferase family 39 protein [Candidatus Sumerlaeaceae bacterium]|nr:glycosyltransferase family 39 protein [Candidatus Sumerlaeaceae bacterium]
MSPQQKHSVRDWLEAAKDVLRSPLVWVVLLAIGMTIVKFLVASRLELFQDEALYWFLGTRDPLAFSPHPPGTPLLARLGTALVGRTELGVRAGNLLLGLFAIPLFYALAGRILSSKVLAAWATLAFALTPIYFSFGSICTPDMPQLFLWIALLYSTWAAVHTDDRWWLAAGSLFGIGLYFKYIIVLYLPALAVYLWWSGLWRRPLESRFFWWGFGIGIAVFAPVAVLQESRTGWGALSYHLRDRQKWDIHILANAAVYLLVHAAYYSPLLFAASVAGLFVAAQRACRWREDRLMFLAAFGLVPLIFFAVIAAVTERELSREQWDAPAYVAGLIAATWLVREWSLAQINKPRPLPLRKVIALAFALAALTILVVIVEALTYLPSALVGKRPLFSATLGWRTLSSQLDLELNDARQKGPTVILTNSFIPAVQYGFYSKLAPEIYVLDHKVNARYGLKGLFDRLGMSVRSLENRRGIDALYVAEGSTTDPSDDRAATLRKRMLEYFEAVEIRPDVLIPPYGPPLKRFHVFLCSRYFHKP